jgi:hypothetical protein
VFQKGRIDVLDRQHLVDRALPNTQRRLHIGDLRRTGRDEEDADLLRSISGLLDSSFPCDLRRDLDGRLDRKKPGDQCREFHTDQPDDRGTGGAYKGRVFHVFADIGAGSLRYQFCGGADFEHVVESDGEKCVEHDVYILQIIKLCIQGRSRKRDRIPVIADVPDGIIGHGLRVVRAVS